MNTKKLFTIVIAGLGFSTLVVGLPLLVSAQVETTGRFQNVSTVPQMPISDAILKLLNTSEWLNTVNKYVKVPLGGNDIKRLSQDQMVHVNQDIAKETGVDIFRFFKFVGGVAVAVLENAARILRGLIPLIP